MKEFKSTDVVISFPHNGKIVKIYSEEDYLNSKVWKVYEDYDIANIGDIIHDAILCDDFTELKEVIKYLKDERNV